MWKSDTQITQYGKFKIVELEAFKFNTGICSLSFYFVGGIWNIKWIHKIFVIFMDRWPTVYTYDTIFILTYYYFFMNLFFKMEEWIP